MQGAVDLEVAVGIARGFQFGVELAKLPAFFCAYMRRVMAVHEASAARYSSNGAMPALPPPRVGGSSLVS